MWKLFNRLAHITSNSSTRTRPAERNPSPTSTSGAFNGVRVSPSTIEVPPAPVQPQAVLSSALPEGESFPPVYSENLMRGERAGVEPRRNLPMVPPPQYTEIPLPAHTSTETATPVIHQPLTLNVPIVEDEPQTNASVYATPTNYTHVVQLPTSEQERSERNNLWELYNVHPNWFGVGRVLDGVEPQYRDQAFYHGIDLLLKHFSDPSQGNGFTNAILHNVLIHVNSLPISEPERRVLIDALRTRIRHEVAHLYNYQHPEMASVNACTIMIRACNNLFGTKANWEETLKWIKRNYSSNPNAGFLTPQFITNFGTLGIPPVVVAPATTSVPSLVKPLPDIERYNFDWDVLEDLRNRFPNWFNPRTYAVLPQYRYETFAQAVNVLCRNWDSPAGRSARTMAMLGDIFVYIDGLQLPSEQRILLLSGLSNVVMNRVYHIRRSMFDPDSANAYELFYRVCNERLGSHSAWVETLHSIQEVMGDNPAFNFITPQFVARHSNLYPNPLTIRPPRPLPVLRDAPLPISRTPAQAQAELSEAQIARIQRGEMPTQTGWMANVPQEQRAGAIAGIVKELLALHADELAEYTMTDWAVASAGANHVRHLVQLLNACTRDEVTVPRDAFFKKIAKTVRKDLVRTITDSGFTPEYNDNFKFLFSLAYWNELKKEENIDRMSHLYA